MKTIRIKRRIDGDWQTVELLDIRAGWVRVKDGSGQLYVLLRNCHPADVRAHDGSQQTPDDDDDGDKT